MYMIKETHRQLKYLIIYYSLTMIITCLLIMSPFFMRHFFFAHDIIEIFAWSEQDLHTALFSFSQCTTCQHHASFYSSSWFAV